MLSNGSIREAEKQNDSWKVPWHIDLTVNLLSHFSKILLLSEIEANKGGKLLNNKIFLVLIIFGRPWIFKVEL
jgi:hypothetical protein